MGLQAQNPGSSGDSQYDLVLSYHENTHTRTIHTDDTLNTTNEKGKRGSKIIKNFTSCPGMCFKIFKCVSFSKGWINKYEKDIKEIRPEETVPSEVGVEVDDTEQLGTNTAAATLGFHEGADGLNTDFFWTNESDSSI